MSGMWVPVLNLVCADCHGEFQARMVPGNPGGGPLRLLVMPDNEDLAAGDINLDTDEACCAPCMEKRFP